MKAYIHISHACQLCSVSSRACEFLEVGHFILPRTTCLPLSSSESESSVTRTMKMYQGAQSSPEIAGRTDAPQFHGLRLKFTVHRDLDGSPNALFRPRPRPLGLRCLIRRCLSRCCLCLVRDQGGHEISHGIYRGGKLKVDDGRYGFSGLNAKVK